MVKPPTQPPGGDYVTADQFERLQRQVVDMGLVVKESAQVNTLERYLDGLVGSLGDYLGPLRDIMPRPDSLDPNAKCALEDLVESLQAPRWENILTSDFDIGLQEPAIIGAPRPGGCSEEFDLQDPRYGSGRETGRAAQ